MSNNQYGQDEYKALDFSGLQADTQEKLLNSYAKEGWELQHIAVKDSFLYVYLNRFNVNEE